VKLKVDVQRGYELIPAGTEVLLVHDGRISGGDRPVLFGVAVAPGQAHSRGEGLTGWVYVYEHELEGL
jgi:hypothetical protein